MLVETSWLGRGRGGGREKSREFRSKLAVGDSLVAVILIATPEGDGEVGTANLQQWRSQLITIYRTSVFLANIHGGSRIGETLCRPLLEQRLVLLQPNRRNDAL